MTTYTLRELLAMGFRYRRVFVVSFLAISLGAAGYILTRPAQYEATTKILLRNDRVYPLVTTEEKAVPKVSTSISEQEINSEIAVLQSQDLLEKVAIACGLGQVPPTAPWWRRVFPVGVHALERAPGTEAAGKPPSENIDHAALAQAVASNLHVELLGRSNVILVSYTSPDPQLAYRVVNTLASAYLEKHLAVHRPAGAQDFFRDETERYRAELQAIKTRLAQFARSGDVVSPQLEKEKTLQRLDEFEARWRETKAAIAEKEELVRSLEAQLALAPSHLVSSVRTSDNRDVVQRLKTTLSDLELKRIELSTKFTSDYPLVQEVEEQIAHVRAELLREEKIVLREETSSTDPTYEKLKGELAMATSQLAASKANAAKISKDVLAYRERSHQLYEKEIAQQDLLRLQQLADENYRLYLRKQEESRISDEMDKQRILNLSIVEQPTVPSDPVGPSRLILLMVAGLFAFVGSTGLVIALDYVNPSFETPQQVEDFLDVPVVAALPRSSRGHAS